MKPIQEFVVEQILAPEIPFLRKLFRNIMGAESLNMDGATYRLREYGDRIVLAFEIPTHNSNTVDESTLIDYFYALTGHHEIIEDEGGYLQRSARVVVKPRHIKVVVTYIL